MNMRGLFGQSPQRSGRPNTSIQAREDARLTCVLAGTPLPITSLAQLRELKRYAVLQRGSGRLPTLPIPVAPEPPWEPFLPTTLTDLDRALTGITAPVLLTPFQRLFGSKAPVVPIFTPELYVPEALCVLRITRSKDAPVTLANTIQFFLSSLPGWGMVSWELVGTHAHLLCQLTCGASHAAHLEGQLRTHYPTFGIEHREDALAQWTDLSVQQYGLSAVAVFPLTRALPAGPEPLNTLVGILDTLAAEEVAGLQILLTPCQAPWAETFLQACRDDLTGESLGTAPHLVTLAIHKTQAPLFAVVIRSFASHPQLSERLAAYFALFQSEYTSLIPVAEIPFGQVKDRVTTRYGMLLNVEELAQVCHFPSALTFAEKLAYAKTSHPAPASALHQDGVILGENRHRGVLQQVALTDAQRTRHMYVVGVSGTGKTTLLLNLIMQDIERGAGLCVLDPHGDLVERQILPRIPAHRLMDVIYVDPADDAHPIPFNILYAHSDEERELLTEDLVAIMRRFSLSWGSQMEGILAHAILAILQSPQGGHLQDLRDVLLDTRVRTQYLATVTDAEVRQYWTHEFPLLPRNAIAPVLTRLTSFLRRRRIRQMVCHTENRLDFRQMMETGKILLVKCAVGTLGEENASFLGALLVAKLQQTVMTRQALAKRERRPFYLYLDEFQYFITPSMEAILSGARKYGLGLILAHQELNQLWSRSREVATSVLANPSTRICFGVGDRDAWLLAEGFAHFDAADLQRLSRGEAIARVERADFDFTLTTLPPPPMPPEEVAQERVATLLRLSRKTYGAQPQEDHVAESPPEVPVPEPLLGSDPVVRLTSKTVLPPVDEDLSPDARAFLLFVGTLEALLPVREVYKRLKVSAEKGTRLKTQLIKADLDGGFERVITLCVTPAVCEALQQLVTAQGPTLAARVSCGLVKEYIALLRSITEEWT